MPGGPTTIGFLYFGAVKLAGYTAAGVSLRRRRLVRGSPWVFGAVRTALGVVAGVGTALVLENVGVTSGVPVFYLGLAPVRYAEWLLILWLFRDPSIPFSRLLLPAFIGFLWSYLLDIPAILSVFALPGGVWIC